MWIILGVFVAESKPATAQENHGFTEADDDLVRAFRVGFGLAHAEESSESPILEVGRFGHTSVLRGTWNNSEPRRLVCMLCTRSETLTQARALGAQLAAQRDGIDPPLLQLSNLEDGVHASVDGIPFAPAKASHAIEPGVHEVVAQQADTVIRADVTLHPDEEIQIQTDVFETVETRNPKTRPAVALAGLGITAAVLGGVFLWLDGGCASPDERDPTGECAHVHNLRGAGWALVAGGALIEVGTLIWLLWPDDDPLPPLTVEE